MIDYDKLKIAMELAENLKYPHYLSTSMGKGHAEYSIVDCEGSLKSMNLIITESLDDLIAKLQELTEPKPKYEDMLNVYWSFNNDIYEGKLDFITRHEESFRYQILMTNGETINLDESQVYPSKESLIEAQIRYCIRLALVASNGKNKDWHFD